MGLESERSSSVAVYTLAGMAPVRALASALCVVLLVAVIKHSSAAASAVDVGVPRVHDAIETPSILSACDESPTVSILGRTFKKLRRNRSYHLRGVARDFSCSKGGANRRLRYAWTIQPSVGGISEEYMQRSSLFVPRNTLRPGKYIFTLKVTLIATGHSAQSSIVVKVPKSRLVCRFKGGRFKTVSTGHDSKLAVNAYDPDTVDHAPVQVTFTCSTPDGAACLTTAGETLHLAVDSQSVMIPAGTLPPGVYRFKVTATKDTRSTTQRMIVHVDS